MLSFSRTKFVLALIFLLVTCSTFSSAKDDASQKVDKKKSRNISAAGAELLEKKSHKEKLIELKKKVDALQESGFHDQVGHSAEAAVLRSYQLRKKKRRRGIFLHRKEASMMDVLFPGVKPEMYRPDAEPLYMITDQVTSRKTHLPYEFYDTLPGCPVPPNLKRFKRIKRRHQRKNLGARLQGAELKPAPYTLNTLQNMTCTEICTVDLEPHQIRWLRKLVERQYRAHLQLDQLPVLMRSSEYNYAVRGYPVGFKAPPSYTGLDHDEFYLYNHLKFIVSYETVEKDEDENNAKDDTETLEGIYITGFDVYPVSIEHKEGVTCGVAENNDPVVNDPNTYLTLRGTNGGTTLKVTYSYEVEWVEVALHWEDRWDVYLIGSPDDDIHFFAIINSLMIVLFLTGAIATIMIRTLRNDISTYNELALLEDGSSDAQETGWKLVHGDVFRPPKNQYPMLLSCLVGAGAQMGSAGLSTLLISLLRLVNPIKKGQTLTAVVILYVLSSSVAGYISARIYKFSEAPNWKLNTIMTATALPGLLVGMFTMLNIFLSVEGAATAVSFLTLLTIFALWVGVSMPLVLVGSFIGYRKEKIRVPTKTNQIARYIPTEFLPWYTKPPASFVLGGILPFGSVCIELFFIMSALWLHQIYYVMGFLLAVLIILAATCAQVSIVMDYLQLCGEDYNWWWKSFFNCASAGGYLFLYSLWFLVSRLELVGFLSVVIYLTYMAMISICFSLFCGSIGFLCAFWFNRTIYGALKVD